MLWTNIVDGVSSRILIKSLHFYKQLHITAFICSACVMGFVLLDPTEEADFDKIISTEDSSFSKSIYTNPRYRRHMEVLLPWLQHQGALE